MGQVITRTSPIAVSPHAIDINDFSLEEVSGRSPLKKRVLLAAVRVIRSEGFDGAVDLHRGLG